MDDGIKIEKEKVIGASLKTPENLQGRNNLKMADLISDQVSTDLRELTSAIRDYSASSGRVATALNWLTGALVLIGVIQILLQALRK